ncbi:ty3-gypsy retrotransposon protein [Tanacetum coccineum]
MWLMCKMQLAQMFGCLARVRVDSGNDAMVCVVACDNVRKCKQSEIWRLAASMEDHKSEIENWALGAEIYIKYYTLRSSLKEDENSMNERVGVFVVAKKYDLSAGSPLQKSDILNLNLQPVEKHSIPVCQEAKGLIETRKVQLAEECLMKRTLCLRKHLQYFSGVWREVSMLVSAVECVGRRLYRLQYRPKEAWRFLGIRRLSTSVASNNTMSQGLSNAPKEHARCADAGSMAIFRNSTIGNGGVEAKGPWLKAKSKILNYLAMVVYHVGDMVAAIMQQHNELIINERCIWHDDEDVHEFTTHSKVRDSERYNWAATQGVNEENLIERFPGDLQKDICRNLFKLQASQIDGIFKESNALSRAFKDEVIKSSFMGLSQPMTELLNDLKQDNGTLDELQQIHRKLDANERVEGFRRKEGLVVFRDRYYIRADSKLKELLLAKFNNTPTASHSGVKRMLVGLSALFYWKGMRKSVEEFISRSSKVAVVKETLIERDALLRRLKQNLLGTKHRMEMLANRKCRDVKLTIRDMVLVKLQPYRQVTVAKRHSNKLAKRYYESFKVLERVARTDQVQVAAFPDEDHEGLPVERPLAICDSRIVLRKGIPSRQVLVQWSGSSPEEAI